MRHAMSAYFPFMLLAHDSGDILGHPGTANFWAILRELLDMFPKHPTTPFLYESPNFAVGLDESMSVPLHHI